MRVRYLDTSCNQWFKHDLHNSPQSMDSLDCLWNNVHIRQALFALYKVRDSSISLCRTHADTCLICSTTEQSTRYILPVFIPSRMNPLFI